MSGKGRKETPIQADTHDGLNEAFWGLWWIQNAGKVMTAKGHYVQLGPPGIGDIVGAPEGGAPLCYIETKREKGGHHRDTQKQWRDWAEAAGHVYVKGRDPAKILVELRDKIEDWHRRRGLSWEPAGDFEAAIKAAANAQAAG